MHYNISKCLAWATRHAPGVSNAKGNWVPVDWLLNNRRRVLSTPGELFMAVIFNEKGRYQFSRPIYEETASARETGMSRVSGQVYYKAQVFVRATQGHSVSEDPMAAMIEVTEANMPNCAVHGTSVHAARSIVSNGMVPGFQLPSPGTGSSSRDKETRLANHFATTLPNDASSVVSGYRSTAEVCIFFDLPAWLDDGKKAYLAPNDVLCVFEPIPPGYFTAAVQVANFYDLITLAPCAEEFRRKLESKQLNSEP